MSTSRTAAAAARSLVNTMRSYAAPHSLMQVMAADFPQLDLRRYAAFQRDLEQRGFAFVADAEIPEVARMPRAGMAPTMLRTMSSADGAIVGSYFQLKASLGGRLGLLLIGLANLRWVAAPRDFVQGMRTRHCVQFHTEFDDGRALATSNAEASRVVTSPPTVERQLLPWNTAIVTLLDAHRRRFDAIVSRGTVRPLAVRTFGDMVAMQQRQNARKAAHRADIGLVTEDEVRRMCARFPKLAAPVYAEVVKLLEDEAVDAKR
jgi:hypothetical protein